MPIGAAARLRRQTRRLAGVVLFTLVGGGVALLQPASLAAHVGTLVYILLGGITLVGVVRLMRTATKHAQQLEQSSDRLERIAQTVPGILCQFELSADGQHARMPYTTRPLEPVFGLSASLEPGSADKMFEHIHPEDVGRFRDTVLASAATLTPFALEWRMRVPGQPERWVDVRSMPQRLPDGATLWTGFVADVTEQRAARQAQLALDAAQRASRAKSEFLSRVSHELRTPLNAVIGFATLMLRDERHALAPLQRDYLGHIRQSGEHLLALINDLLDVSSVEAGRVEATMTDVRVDELLDAVAVSLGEQAAAAGIALSVAPVDPELGVRADATRIKQVLLNLASNAVKYNRAGGSVTLSAQRSGTAEVRSVVGAAVDGLSGEQQAHLFEPFNRLGAEQRRIPGTGIGLTITKRLVELMGGRIEVASEAGRGSRFSVLLTRVMLAPRAQSAVTAAAALPEPDSGATATLDLLYAEDNPVNARLVEEVVATCPGVRLRLAETGTAALQAARARPPDLMLVDMHLGDMTGLQLHAALRADPATAGIPCIALTADALPESAAQAREAGFADYMTKPIDVFALRLRLDDARARLATAPAAAKT